MNTTFKYTSLLCLTFALTTTPSIAFAQEGGKNESQLSVGALFMGFRSPFEAENKKANGDERITTTFVPYISYHSDRFYFEGMEMGYKAFKYETDDIQFNLSAVVSGRMKAGDTRDKITADAGLNATMSGSLGFLSLTVLHDVTDTHNGMEAKASIGHVFHGGKFSFTPTASLVYQNRKMANYVYGVSTAEHDKMVDKGKRVLPTYTITESAKNFALESVFTYAATNRITLLAYGNITFLDKSIKAHLGINNSTESSIGLGLLYNF